MKGENFKNLEIATDELNKLEGEYPENLEIQDKIMRVFGKDTERAEFLKRIASGEITKEEFAKILGEIGPDGKLVRRTGGKNINESLAPYETIKEEIQNNAGYRILLNLILGRPPEIAFSVSAIMVFLDEYPEPHAFEQAVSKAAYRLSSEQRQDLYHHAGALAKMLYGQREDYWEQFKLMEEEAAFIYGTKTEAFVEISKKESRELLNRVEVHGDPWGRRQLTPQDLEKNGLGPKIKVEVEGATIWFSSTPYILDGNRMAVVGYLENKDGKLVARSFYRSNSHGIWKYLPKYLGGAGRVSWYDKGFGQESISLPIPFQRALADIAKEIPVYVEDREFIFAGTARNITRNEANTYQGEVEERPIRLRGNFYHPKHMIPPRKVAFTDKNQEPDYSEMLVEWRDKSPIYGEVTAKVFPSKDGKLSYLFMQDALGRVWIAAIDTNSKISSTGVREEWIEGGDLTTPAYQYYEESGGYGNSEIQSGHYVDMFKNYLSNVPIIQEYSSRVRKYPKAK